MRPRLLDLFSGAGGAAVGYARAGFDVFGVDVVNQPNYPFTFFQMDALRALEQLIEEPLNISDEPRFHAIHASPPCQAYTMLRRVNARQDYPDLVGPVRDLLVETGLPYVIENVVGAPLLEPSMLCGSSFGLRLRRHRLFETNWPLMAPPCAHGWQMDKKYPALNGADRKAGRRSGIVGVYGNGGDKRADLWAGEMEIDWMSQRELTQAIPPVYTELIGQQLLAHLKVTV